MNVLMISDNLIKGGKERRMLEILRYFDARPDFNVNLIILRDKIEYPEIYDLKNTKLIVIKRLIKKDPLVFFKIWRICTGLKPDIIHSWGSMPSIYVFLICFLKRIKLVNGMITNAKCPKYSGTWFRSKITFPFSDVVMSNSIAGINAYPVGPAKVKVIYNGVHLDRFNVNLSPETVKQHFRIQTPMVIGMIGAFHPRKDYKTYLGVAVKICRIKPDVTFLAVGSGGLLQAHMEMVPSDLKGRIVFTGAIQKVEEVISIMDIGVLTTNTEVHQEGISNVIIEYMGMSKPVIATEGGGTVEIISDGEDGYLIPPADSVALEQKIMQLLDDSNRRKTMGQQGRKKIESKFNVDVMMKSITQMYYDLKIS